LKKNALFPSDRHKADALTQSPQPFEQILIKVERNLMKTNESDKQHTHKNEQDLLQELLQRRYLLKDRNGRILENSQQMFERVLKAIAAPKGGYGATAFEIEAVFQKFFDLMSRRFFLPNSPTLKNAGRPRGMLSACFVLGIKDSIEGIFETIKRTALVQKAGGGTGFAFDVLRPTGDYVSSTGGQTSGPISFWRVFAEATNAIQQGANHRGANMGMMSVEHPDILSFIAAKKNLTDFVNFNISVKIRDTFMAALQLKPDDPHVVRNPRDGRIKATNPCEETMLDEEACCLGSMTSSRWFSMRSLT